MKRTIAILLILITVNTAHAQETMGFGLSAGFVSGFGFSFRYMPEKGFGVQPSAIYIKTADLTFSNFGLQGLYVLNHSMNTSLYVVGGYCYHYKRTTKDVTYNRGDPLRERTEEVTTRIERNAVGAGMGYAARLTGSERIWGSIELLLTSYRGDVIPYPQLAAHYFFK